MGSRRGFTLIELLVVTAVIALLAAIIIPVFVRAREKARMTKCMANQKQLAAMLTMYAQDNDLCFPPDDGNPWPEKLAAYQEHKIFDCPTTSFKGSAANPEYALNKNICGQTAGDIKEPTTTMLTADAVKEITLTSSSLDLDERHNGKLIASFVDGHLEVRPAAGLPGGSITLNRIVFWSNRDGNQEIYTMKDDGTSSLRLTNMGAVDDSPAWSPDGGYIAFHSDRDGNSEIYRMRADGSDQLNLTNNAAIDQSPVWSPDSSRIAFASDRDGNLEVYVMKADGSRLTRLTDNAAGDYPSAWSPDGKQIAFVSNRDGNMEIYVMNADGTSQTRLTDNGAEDTSPAWSPDGTKIVFNSNRDGNPEIYMMNADGSGQKRLTNNPANDVYPTWSPDGGKILFTSNRDGNFELYTMLYDGSGPKRLTNNPADDFCCPGAWR